MAAIEPALSAVGSVLDLAPELGSDIRREDRQAARQACWGELLSVPSGRWDLPPGTVDPRSCLGLVIISGVLCREVQLRDRHLVELLGVGDVLHLPGHVEDRRLCSAVTLSAVTQTELLALGVPFIRAAARWPSLLVAVHRRLEAQREEFAVQALIAHLPKAQERLLLMLWHFADRWGFVTPDGIVLRLPLSHDLLGQLTAARRSTASLALGRLQEGGEIKRLGDGSWLLTQAAERAVEALATTPAAGYMLGEMLALRIQSNEARANARALRAEAKLTRAQPPLHDPPAA